jgi:hypothetical protein
MLWRGRAHGRATGSCADGFRVSTAVSGESLLVTTPSSKPNGSNGRVRALMRRVRDRLVPGPEMQAQLADMNRRLERIERQLDALEKIWMKTRHVEPAVQAVLRKLYLDGDGLPYPEKLTAQRFRLASQNQEDGLTIALLKEIGVAQRKFVEIGAGLSGGNSAFLAREWGWTGLMVDGSHARMEQVARRFPGVTAVGAWVTRENINDLITQQGFSGEVDLFSLDIDGNDYWIWEAMTACSPRIAILEYNSMFGPDRAVTVAYDPHFDRHRYHSMYYGASLAACTRLSARKGYRLVAVEPTGINAFFLRNDLAPHIPACDPHRAFRLLEKHDLWLKAGEDIFRYAAESGLSLIDIS